MKKRRRRPVEERYWSKVDTSAGPDKCWPWVGARNRQGYAHFKDENNQVVRATRWAYRRFIRSLADDEHVLHSCDNPPCMNPAHWFTGSNLDNVRDRESKGRNRPSSGDRNGSRLHPERLARGDLNGARLHPDRVPRGESHGMAVLNDSAVVAMRDAFDAGARTIQSLADDYGVSRRTAALVVRRQSWRHIT